MTCPRCGERIAVVDIVHDADENETYRKRKCKVCGHVFYTIEFETDYRDIINVWGKWYRSKLRYKKKGEPYERKDT